jgi:hypothetical protein
MLHRFCAAAVKLVVAADVDESITYNQRDARWGEKAE